jgi:hypothetical protein
MDYEAKAKSNLKYYFRLLATKQGIRWDSDNDAEVEAIVDYILDAVDQKLKKILSTARGD